MSKKPLLSFCIPTYNRADNIVACVRHILEYPGDDIEVVISDNASPDDTIARLSAISDTRLRVCRNQTNIGPGGNYIVALEAGAGCFSLLLSDEDRIHVDRLDEALQFLRDVDPDCALVRFAMEGVLSLKKEYYCAPAGPETFVFALINCGDVAGNAYNRTFIGNLNPDKYVVTDPASGFSVMDVLFAPGREHSFCFCPIVLVERRFDESAYDIGVDIVETDPDDEGYDVCYFAPDTSSERVFRPLIETAGNLYGNDASLNALYGWAMKFSASYATFVSSIYMYLQNDGWTNLKFNNPRLREAFFSKWGTPWDMVRRTLTQCLETTRIHTGDAFWQSVADMCGAFFDNRLDMRVDGYTFAERFIAGDLICMIGVDSTGHDYYPREQPAFLAAEFEETDRVFRLFSAGKYDEVIAFPELRTKRDYFFRGAAHLLRGDTAKARECLLAHVNAFTNATTLRDSIFGQQTVVQSHYLLGVICQARGDFLDALKHFSICRELTDVFVLGGYLTAKRLNRLGAGVVLSS